MGTLYDVITSSQTWSLETRAEHQDLLHDLMGRMYGKSWLYYTDVDEEWSGPGVYRLQIRLNRPEGRPRYSLKWEGV